MAREEEYEPRGYGQEWEEELTRYGQRQTRKKQSRNDGLEKRAGGLSYAEREDAEKCEEEVLRVIV